MKFAVRVGTVVLMLVLSGCSGRPADTHEGDSGAVTLTTMADYDKAGTVNERLILAAYAGDLDMTKSMISDGADVNASDATGTTPLHLAATYGNLEVAEYLIHHGAKPNATDRYGRTPLFLSATWGHTDVATLLLGNGADPTRRSARGETVVQAAIAIGNHDIIHALQDAQRGRDSSILKRRGIASE